MQTKQKIVSYNPELFESKQRDTSSILIALILTLVIHALAILLIPSDFSSIVKKNHDNNLKDNKEILVEILPPETTLPEYVEANPTANNEKPINPTNQESFKDQRAADLNPDKNSKSPMPYIEGENKEYKKIVSGQFEQTSVPQAAMKVLETKNKPLENIKNPKEKNLIESKPSDSQSDKLEKKSINKKTSDEGTYFATIKKDDENSLNKSDSKNINDNESEEKKLQESEQAIQIAKQNLPTPKARPSLSMKIPPGPLADNRIHANSTGTVAVDSRFSEFGAYQQRMIEAISRQWHLLASQYDLGNCVNTHVVIEFYLNSKGELTSIKTMYNTSSDIGKTLCEQSIVSTAPYGIWTEEMVKVFGGKDQLVRFTFFYR